MTRKPILCVDFDGVINSYVSGWQGTDVVNDPPVPGALIWLAAAIEFFDVRVYSSRSKEPGGIDAMHAYIRRHAEAEFGRDHALAWGAPDVYPIVFCSEKPPAFLTIDDRAVCFDGDFSKLNPTKLLDFQPWFKKKPTAEHSGTIYANGLELNKPVGGIFAQYRRTQIAEMTPWCEGFDMSRVSVSAPDREAGSPKPGDMIARNPKNHDDKWLVAAAYFADNFEPT